MDELISDIFSDVPSDFESDDESSDETIIEYSSQRQSQSATREDDSSDSDDDDDEVDDESIDNCWNKHDSIPVIANFIGEPGIKRGINHSTISEIVKQFLDDDFFQLICLETNRYHQQHEHVWKNVSPKWVDVDLGEIKRFFGLIILMGQVRKGCIRDYWSTNSLIETPIFGKVMSRNRFEQIFQSLHFNNSEDQTEGSDRLFKIKPLIDYCQAMFGSIYSPERELSLDESMISW